MYHIKIDDLILIGSPVKNRKINAAMMKAKNTPRTLGM